MKFKKKTVIGYANPSVIKDFCKIKSINKQSYTSLNLRQTNLYMRLLESMTSQANGGNIVWEEDKSLKKYKITIERIK